MTPLPLFLTLAQVTALGSLDFDLRTLPTPPAAPCAARAAQEIVVCGRSAARQRLGALPDLPADPPLAIKLPGAARIEPGAIKGVGLSLVIPF